MFETHYIEKIILTFCMSKWLSNSMNLIELKIRETISLTQF